MLQITPTEFEEPEALAASPPPMIRKQQAAAILASSRVRVAALKQDPAFKAEGTCFLQACMPRLPCGVCWRSDVTRDAFGGAF